MKDIVLVIVLLLAVGLSVVVVRFAEKADKASRNLEEERYSRMVAEETLQKNEGKMSSLQMELADDQDKMNKIEDILTQEKGINSDLKKQYDELTEAKANLESKLQTVLQQKAQDDAALQTQISAQAVAKPAAVAATPSAPAAAAPAAAAH